MKFEELKKALVGGKVSKNYLITGRDVFLSDNAYRLIKEHLNISMPELNEIKYNDLDVDMDSVVNALLVPAAFSDNKIVYVDVSVKGVKIKSFDSLKKYLESGDFYNTLIIKVGENIDSMKGLNLANFETIDCDGLSQDIACKLIVAEVKKKGKDITVGAVKTLLEYTGSDLKACMNEVLKLANYVEKEITEDVVKEMVTKTLEYKIFELTEALAKKQVDKVYEILADLKHKKTGYQGLIGLIYAHFRRLLHLAITKYSTAEQAQYLGIKEYAVRKSMEQVRLFTPKKLKQINDLCMTLEYQLKTSQITSINAVDMLVLQILQ